MWAIIMSDLITYAAAIGLNPDLARTGATLIENLLGEPCKVAGSMLSDQIYFWQWKNRIRIAEKAQKILDEKKIAAKVIPPGFLIPLLEAAGNVEDETLQDMWASLLASSVESETSQHPAFVAVLSSLSIEEATLLDYLNRKRGFNVSVPEHKVSELDSSILEYVQNAHINPFRDVIPDRKRLFLSIDHLDQLGMLQAKKYLPGVLMRHPTFVIRLSTWGKGLITACTQGPEKLQEEE